MLMLIFYLGNECYAVSNDDIIEILPLIQLKSVPHSPDYLAGIFNYRGTLTPVIDLRQLIFNTPCERYLSTRIIIFQYHQHSIGLLAEQVTDTINDHQAQWHDLDMKIENAPYIGPLLTDHNGQMIQSLHLSALISEEISHLLFNQG